MVYGPYNELVTGAYKPTYNWGPHIVEYPLEQDPQNSILKSKLTMSYCSQYSWMLIDEVHTPNIIFLALKGHLELVPIGSMYGIYANIGGILMVNVTIYGIHGSYGVYNPQN